MIQSLSALRVTEGTPAGPVAWHFWAALAMAATAAAGRGGGGGHWSLKEGVNAWVPAKQSNSKGGGSQSCT